MRHSPCPYSSAIGLLELGSLPSTGVTRLPRYYEPVRHPRRPGLSLAGVRLGFRSPPMGLPVSQQLPVCRHAVTITPGGPLGRIVRDEGLSTPRFFTSDGGLPRINGGSAPTLKLSRPARCSLLVTACRLAAPLNGTSVSKAPAASLPPPPLR